MAVHVSFWSVHKDTSENATAAATIAAAAATTTTTTIDNERWVQAKCCMRLKVASRWRPRIGVVGNSSGNELFQLWQSPLSEIGTNCCGQKCHNGQLLAASALESLSPPALSSRAARWSLSGSFFPIASSSFEQGFESNFGWNYFYHFSEFTSIPFQCPNSSPFFYQTCPNLFWLVRNWYDFPRICPSSLRSFSKFADTVLAPLLAPFPPSSHNSIYGKIQGPKAWNKEWEERTQANNTKFSMNFCVFPRNFNLSNSPTIRMSNWILPRNSIHKWSIDQSDDNRIPSLSHEDKLTIQNDHNRPPRESSDELTVITNLVLFCSHFN